MNETEAYVVRIYRRDAAGLAGVVESVASGERRSFRTAESLWRALHDFRPVRRGVSDGIPTGDGT